MLHHEDGNKGCYAQGHHKTKLCCSHWVALFLITCSNGYYGLNRMYVVPTSSIMWNPSATKSLCYKYIYIYKTYIYMCVYIYVNWACSRHYGENIQIKSVAFWWNTHDLNRRKAIFLLVGEAGHVVDVPQCRKSPCAAAQPLCSIKGRPAKHTEE